MSTKTINETYREETRGKFVAIPVQMLTQIMPRNKKSSSGWPVVMKYFYCHGVFQSIIHFLARKDLFESFDQIAGSKLVRDRE